MYAIETIQTSIINGIKRNIPKTTDTATANMMTLRGKLPLACFWFMIVLRVCFIIMLI